MRIESKIILIINHELLVVVVLHGIGIFSNVQILPKMVNFGDQIWAFIKY